MERCLLVTEKSGTLYQITEGTKTEIKNVPVYKPRPRACDIALHPDYINSWIYITYSSTGGEGEGGNTKLIRETARRSFDAD
jgi:hypothetical protein